MTLQRVTVAMTGASGARYGLRLTQLLLQADCEVSFLISKAAQLVLATETELHIPSRPGLVESFLTQHFGAKAGRLKVYGREQWTAPVASGSGAPAAMVICPCSTGCLAAIAHGASNNLIERAADVALKEQRRLIVMPRESPYSVVHLENMLKLARMGVTVLPASPGFYHKPATVDDLVDFIVARILDQLGVEQTLVQRWGA